MNKVWQPGIPMRFKTNSDGTKVLQQVWCLWKLGHEEWYQTNEHRWEDVPTDIDDPKYWSKDE